MIVDKNTKMFFSVSEAPGNFGSLLYNSAFQKLGINAVYKPLQLNRSQNFSLFLEGLMYLKPSGLSISMPFKNKAYEYYSKRCPDPIVHEVKNVNTYKFTENSSIIDCYNTDYYGFERIWKTQLQDNKSVVVYGDGAISKTIQCVLKSNKISFSVIRHRDLKTFPEADLLINASPVGMDNVEDHVFTKKVIEKYKSIFDVVVKKHTNLLKLSNKLNKFVCSGVWLSFYQLLKQWEIYTETPSPHDLFLTLLKRNKYV